MKRSNARGNLGENPAWRQLGDRVRAKRLFRGWSLADLAGRLHVSKGYVSRLECGKARPALTMVTRLGKLLGMETEELLIWADFLPDDVKRILREHSGEALALLRESFGDTPHQDDQADAAPLAVREPSSHYGARLDLYELVHGDCFAWLDNRESNSIHAIVTDPPYGLKEYSAEETTKLRRGRGGVWRIPPHL